jgi:uncharacterized membrane protein YhhN
MYWLILFVLVAAGFDWLAIIKKTQRVKYITKPLVIILLIAWFYAFTGFHSEGILFALALVFSGLGDVWLMLPGNFFLMGLAAFFVAHGAYIAAFTPTLPRSPIVAVILAVALIIVSIFFFTQIRAGIIRTRGARRLRVLSAVYCFILTIMTVSAISTLTRPEWLFEHALQAAIGGVLFFISDTLLAYDRFVKPMKYGRLAVRVTYHLGQILLISGAAMHLIH